MAHELRVQDMLAYLSTSISSLNTNKLNGLLAEVELRAHLTALGYGDRVSAGGWIFRSEGAGTFAKTTVALFPEVVVPGQSYPPGRAAPQPAVGMHAVFANLHSIGITPYFCYATVQTQHDPASLVWQCQRLGATVLPPPHPISAITGFNPRPKKYNWLRYKTVTGMIPDACVPDEFSKEHLRVSFQTAFMSETSDIDGVFWGKARTYPIEIKEKTVAIDKRAGEYFGLDVGPFVKLAFYASRRGNMHSLFIVREIDEPIARKLKAWWMIPFETLAEFASWVPIPGGKAMGGGASAVIKIPKSAFVPLDATSLAML